MINLSKDIKRNISILFEYYLPLILTAINLKIEKEYYKKVILLLINSKSIFFLMEGEIEKNVEEDIINYKSVFTCRKITKETIYVLRNKL